MKEHSEENEKPFPCFLCDDRFERPVEWMEHLASHGNNGMKKYSCDQCNYSTYRKGNLSIHKSFKHVTDKPWDCMFCDSKFPKKANMRRHIHHFHSGLVGDANNQRALVKAAKPSGKKTPAPQIVGTKAVKPSQNENLAPQIVKTEVEKAVASVSGNIDQRVDYIVEGVDAEYIVQQVNIVNHNSDGSVACH